MTGFAFCSAASLFFLPGAGEVEGFGLVSKVGGGVMGSIAPCHAEEGVKLDGLRNGCSGWD